MAATPPANTGSPNDHRWQFSLRQLFAAITGIAILLGWALWGGWVRSDAVVYLSIAVLAGVFSCAARQGLIGAGAILAALWLTGVMTGVASGPSYLNPSMEIRVDSLKPASLWLTVPLVFYLAAFLRANS